MRIRITFICLCFMLSMSIMAQHTITLQLRDVPLPEALQRIHRAAPHYRINYIYNDLEDFTVTADIRQLSVPDAVRAVTVNYPIHLTFDGNKIYVECSQKEPYRLRGRITDEKGHPVHNANITIIGSDGHSVINHGTSNINGQFVVPCPIQRAIGRLTHVGYEEVVNLYDMSRIYHVTMREKTTPLAEIIIERNTQRLPPMDYDQFYRQISDEVWGSYMPEFNRMDTPELWADSAVVILTELDSVLTVKGGESFWTTNRSPLHVQYELHRRRYKINQEEGCKILSKIPYDKTMVTSFEHEQKSTKKKRTRIKNCSAIGIRIIKPNGTIYTVNTSQYLRPSDVDDPVNLRPDSIELPLLQTGDIIDMFTYNEQWSYDALNPLHHLWRFQQPFPVVDYRMACRIDKGLNAAFNYWGTDSSTIRKQREKKGSYYLARHLYFQDPSTAPIIAGAAIYTRLPKNSFYNHRKVSKVGIVTPNGYEEMLSFLYFYKFRERLYGIVLPRNDTDVQDALYISTFFADSLASTSLSSKKKAEIIVGEAQRIIHQVPDSYRNQFIRLLLVPFERAGIEYDLWLTTPVDREPIDYLIDAYSIELVIHLKEGINIYNDVDRPYETPGRLKGRTCIVAHDLFQKFTLR
ncbi:MAG: hypothetical protein IKX22_01550 [Prevotella sp.]|nr:hypothetical protein [Prevotella sp.]